MLTEKKSANILDKTLDFFNLPFILLPLWLTDQVILEKLSIIYLVQQMFLTFGKILT